MASAEIKRVSANVKAQFLADGYKLMGDARAAFPVSRRRADACTRVSRLSRRRETATLTVKER